MALTAEIFLYNTAKLFLRFGHRNILEIMLRLCLKVAESNVYLMLIRECINLFMLIFTFLKKDIPHFEIKFNTENHFPINSI